MSLQPVRKPTGCPVFYVSVSSNFATLAAIRRASSRVSSLAAERRPRLLLEIDVRERLSVTILHDETSLAFFDGPGRREAALGHCGRHGTRSSCRTSRSETTASLMLPPRAALPRQVATWRQVSRLWPLGRQMTLHELPHIGKRLKRRDGRDFPRYRPRPVRAGQLGYSSRTQYPSRQVYLLSSSLSSSVFMGIPAPTPLSLATCGSPRT